MSYARKVTSVVVSALSMVVVAVAAQLALSATPASATSYHNDNYKRHESKEKDKDHEHKHSEEDTDKDKHKDNDHEKYRICHATSSRSNPYVSITVARPAVDGIAGNSGHEADHYGRHKGPIFTDNLPKHADWGDIIPPVPGAHNGLNWTTAGQAIYNNGCKTPKTTPPQPPKPGHDHDHDTEKKVTICHATGSVINPYVRITVSVAAAYNGHLNHQDKRDIIPPFEYQGKQYSLNWDAAGQAIWNSRCCNVQGGMGSGPVVPTPPQTSTPVVTTTTTPVVTTAAPAKLAETGSNVLISTSVALFIIGMSGALGLLTRKRLAAQA